MTRGLPTSATHFTPHHPSVAEDIGQVFHASGNEGLKGAFGRAYALVVPGYLPEYDGYLREYGLSSRVQYLGTLVACLPVPLTSRLPTLPSVAEVIGQGLDASGNKGFKDVFGRAYNLGVPGYMPEYDGYLPEYDLSNRVQYPGTLVACLPVTLNSRHTTLP